MPESMTVERNSICGDDAGPRCRCRNPRKSVEKRYYQKRRLRFSNRTSSRIFRLRRVNSG
jgi:hypothetical protein